MRTPQPYAGRLGRAGLVALATAFALASSSCSTERPEAEPDSAPPAVSSTAAPSDTAAGDPSGSPAEPTILFQRNGTRRTMVAWVARDGSGEVAMLPDVGTFNQTNPDWSPDGTRIVFAMTDGTTDDLFVADAGATKATKLVDCVAPCAYLDDPAWSPDGKHIVYSRTDDRDGVGISTLETVTVRSGRTRVLLGPWTDRFTAGARWSPDGRRIVFELVDKTGPALDADLSGVTLTVLGPGGPHRIRSLTDPSLFAATADWSPDGRWIVYSALADAADDAPDLFVLAAAGGAPRRLTELAPSGGYAAEPTFTPTGATIVFSGGRSPEESDLLLEVGLGGRGPVLATGTVEVHGRHPRLRPRLSDG